MSPIIAKLAETPPMVGSVRIDTNGSRALVSSCSTAVVFAIWNSELTPSCMRAPPLEVMHTNGMRFSYDTRTPRTKRSPTTEPIDPPMKSNSKTVRIEQLLDALAGRHSSVMRAFRTHIEVLLEIGAVQDRLARRTLDPQPLGNRFLGDPRRRLDTRRQELLQPAHLRFPMALWTTMLLSWRSDPSPFVWSRATPRRARELELSDRFLFPE